MSVVDGKTVELGLTPDGVAQAEKLRDRLATSGEIKPDVLIVSPAQRAQETAAIIAPALGQPILTDARVDEWQADDGTLSEDEFMVLWRQTPDAQKPFTRFAEGFETLSEFWQRAHASLHTILSEHSGKAVAIVTHGGVIQASFAYFFGYSVAAMPPASIDVRKASITHWYKLPEKTMLVLERFNDYGHLK